MIWIKLKLFFYLTTKTNKIIKKINRDLIGTRKIKQSLKEAIAFKQLKNEELIHNYLSDFIKEKQLFLILEDVDRVNQLFVYLIIKIRLFSTKFIFFISNTKTPFDHFKTGEISLSTKLEWCRDLITAIDYLHLHSVVHKKIFPS